MEDIKNFCSLPWTGFSNDPDGKVRPCCIFKGHITDDNGKPYYVQTHTVKEIFSSAYMKNLRDQFRSGEMPQGCETCVKDESNGYKSKRITYTESQIGRSVDFYKDPDFPIEYQMILSNACNLKCRSCTPSHSSMWQAEHKVLWGTTGYEMEHGQSGENKSILWETRDEWMSKVKRLEIVGGEPFFINRWKILWDELIEKRLSRHIWMDMCTNATIYSGDIIEHLADNFKSLGVGLSIDGIGPIYNYLRHPAKWEEVQKNLIKYHEIRNVGFSYSHTVGWINAWHLPEFHTWVKENTPNFRIWNNIIHWPRHMSVIMIPEEIKIMIKRKWDTYDWGKYSQDVDAIANLMFSEMPDEDEIKREYEKFVVHDKFRNENILDIIPQEFSLLNRYFK